jgi:alkyl hydroperoxide reductase subunit AhpC
METENQKHKRETIAKWNGKTIYDSKFNETFEFDSQRDWFVLFHEPKRFTEVNSL